MNTIYKFTDLAIEIEKNSIEDLLFGEYKVIKYAVSIGSSAIERAYKYYEQNTEE